MGSLTNITKSDEDLTALVCKLDDAKLQVLDQYLNDTSLIPIGDGISLATGKQNEVALMQRFITSPLICG